MGKIKYFKLKGKTIFPVTRAEGVLYKNTTVDKMLRGIEDGKYIPNITNEDVDVIVGTKKKKYNTI